MFHHRAAANRSGSIKLGFCISPLQQGSRKGDGPSRMPRTSAAFSLHWSYAEMQQGTGGLRRLCAGFKDQKCLSRAILATFRSISRQVVLRVTASAVDGNSA